MSAGPGITPAMLAQAANDARAARSGWLAALSSGMVSVADVLAAACASPALRRLLLVDVLVASEVSDHAPSTAAKMAKAKMASMSRYLGTPVDAKVNLAWLFDARSEGRRLDALANTMSGTTVVLASSRWPYASPR